MRPLLLGPIRSTHGWRDMDCFVQRIEMLSLIYCCICFRDFDADNTFRLIAPVAHHNKKDRIYSMINNSTTRSVREVHKARPTTHAVSLPPMSNAMLDPLEAYPPTIEFQPLSN